MRSFFLRARVIVGNVLLIVLLFTGCKTLQLQHVEFLSYHSDLILTLDDREHLSINWEGTSLNPKDQADLDDTRSFAKSKSGERFSVMFLKNPYDSGMKSKWTGGFLGLIEHKSGEVPKRVQWPNGIWHLHIEFTNKVKKDPIDVDIEIKTQTW
jgi:hypothetical protein